MSHPNAAQMTQLGAQVSSGLVRLARLAAEFDGERGYERDGCTSTLAWLKLHCRLSKGLAMEVLAVARQLPQLPQVEKAISSGSIGFEHAAAIAESAERLGSDSLLSHQAELVARAEASDPSAFREEVRRVEHQVDAERMRQEAEWAYRSRGLDVVTKSDGRVKVEGLLDPEGGAVLKKALETALGVRNKSETRTERQRRADGLIDLARRALSGREFGVTGCQPPHLNVVVDSRTGVGAIDGLGAVPRETIERLICDCALSVNGSPETRSFSGAKRRSLALRLGRCFFPSCDRPADWCDGHHLQRWALRGKSTVENGALLCRFHHRLVHEGGWQFLVEGGNAIAIAPDGRRLESRLADPVPTTPRL